MKQSEKSQAQPAGIFLATAMLITLTVMSSCGKKDTFGILPAGQNNPAVELHTVGESFTAATQQAQQKAVQIDVLFVVDNSSSMDPSQARLRNALSDFATTYLKPSYDIRTGVITTDTYLANPGFNGYLNSKAAGTLRVRDIYPDWGSDYAKLGKHDGPIPALCNKSTSHYIGNFYYGYPKCFQRETAQTDAATAIQQCLHPSNPNDLTACVNIVGNDKIHSGQPIVSTVPPAGQAADATFIQNQVDSFVINASPATSGSGRERGLGSLVEFMNGEVRNDGTTKFFRPGSQRVIVFLSDEDDQTMDDAAGVKKYHTAFFHPNTGYAIPCKQSTTVDGFTYTLSACVDQELLIPVPTIKGEIDQAFAQIDTKASTPGTYFVASIVATTGASIQALQKAPGRQP